MSPAMPVAASGQPCEDPGAGKGRSGSCFQCGHQVRPMSTCRLGAWNLLDLSATLVQLRGGGPRGPPLGETILHFHFQESFPSAQWLDHFLQKRETAHFRDGGLQAFVFSSVKARVIVVPPSWGSGVSPPGFPGGLVVKNPPTSAGDAGSIPGPGRSHRPQSSKAGEPRLLSWGSRAHESQLLKPSYLEPVLRKSEYPPPTPQLDKKLAQQWRPRAAKIK